MRSKFFICPSKVFSQLPPLPANGTPGEKGASDPNIMCAAKTGTHLQAEDASEAGACGASAQCALDVKLTGWLLTRSVRKMSAYV